MSDRPFAPVGSNATITSTDGLTATTTVDSGGNVVRFLNNSTVDGFVRVATTASATTGVPIARLGGEVRIPKSDGAVDVAAVPASTATFNCYAQSGYDKMGA